MARPINSGILRSFSSRPQRRRRSRPPIISTTPFNIALSSTLQCASRSTVRHIRRCQRRRGSPDACPHPPASVDREIVRICVTVQPWPTDWSLGFVDAAARWLVRVDKSGQRRGECLAFVWAEPPIFCGISVPSTDRSSRSYRLKSSSLGSEKQLRAKSSLSRSTRTRSNVTCRSRVSFFGHRRSA